jgi:elongation factor Ts
VNPVCLPNENVGKTGVRETKMEDKKMAVTASMVKELREMTGAGMMDCKKALNETNGNMDEAIEYLRKNGQAKAEKKAGRIAAEGIVMAEVKDDKAAAIVEVNSETDFVAKNADFQAYVKAVVNQALTTKAANMDEFMAEAWNEDAAKTVKDVLTEKIAVIGENLNIRRFEKVETEGCVVSYIHGGGRIGVLVEADTDVVNDEIKACLKNVAMQVAAMSPKYVSRDEVDQDFLEHEKEILLAQAKKENPNKPDNIIEKMIIGRLNKEMKEICLLDQVYVQDSDLTVAKYVEKVAKENGANVAVKKFVRFETGEGLEKKNEDFAAEVAAQMGN